MFIVVTQSLSVVCFLQEILNFIVPASPPVIQAIANKIITKILHIICNVKATL